MDSYLANLPFEERVKAMAENKRREEEYTRGQAEARQRRETERMQAELESYLTRRGKEFERLTGRTPTEDEMAGWQLEYANARENEQISGNRRRYDQAAGQVF